jgi:hypothetical protein
MERNDAIGEPPTALVLVNAAFRTKGHRSAGLVRHQKGNSRTQNPASIHSGSRTIIIVERLVLVGRTAKPPP